MGVGHTFYRGVFRLLLRCINFTLRKCQIIAFNTIVVVSFTAEYNTMGKGISRDSSLGSKVSACLREARPVWTNVLSEESLD